MRGRYAAAALENAGQPLPRPATSGGGTGSGGEPPQGDDPIQKYLDKLSLPDRRRMLMRASGTSEWQRLAALIF